MAPASISLKTDIKLLVAEDHFVAGQMERHVIPWHGLVGSVADGAAGVGHVIHQNGHAVFDVAHQDHAVHFVGLLPFFVDEGKIHVQTVGDGCHTAQRTQKEVNEVAILSQRVPARHLGSGESLEAHRLAPPASGETIMQFFHSGMFSLIHLRTAGSA